MTSAYDKPCDYELTDEERSLLTCATGLLYKKKHYRNYLYLPSGYVDNLIKLGLVEKECQKAPLDSSDGVYYYLTDEGIKTAYIINGLKGDV